MGPVRLESRVNLSENLLAPQRGAVPLRDTTDGGVTMEPAETLIVDSEIVACDGGDGALGHPRVYLNMEGKGQIDCPYCGRRYVLAEGAASAGH